MIITLNHKKDGFVLSIHADIVQIIEMAVRKLWLPQNATKFEVVIINSERVVKSCLNGKCKFRIGLEQHIEISEEKL